MEFDPYHDFFVLWRAINVVVGFAVFVFLCWVLWSRRKSISQVGRAFLQAHTALMGAIVVLGLVSILHDHPIGPQSALASFALFMTIRAIYRDWQERTGRKPRSGDMPVL